MIHRPQPAQFQVAAQAQILCHSSTAAQSGRGGAVRIGIMMAAKLSERPWLGAGDSVTVRLGPDRTVAALRPLSAR